ncbi:MAG: Uma2 family endonuclease [Pyrinomonadaceae bacterium]|nr:Uma2 family endonuclease [Pyrinomonadaceae bacterium]
MQQIAETQTQTHQTAEPQVHTVQDFTPPEVDYDYDDSNEPQVRYWIKDEYYKLAELGFFEGRRTELIEGEIIEMSAMNVAHATTIRLCLAALREVFAKGFVVDSQLPFSLGSATEPKPDIAVFRGGLRDFIHAHPKDALLIVEISDTTLRYDRVQKSSLYAKNGIEDYWIVNINARCVEVYRRPFEHKDAPHGFYYLNTLTFIESDEISPLAAPETMIKVADLLP